MATAVLRFGNVSPGAEVARWLRALPGEAGGHTQPSQRCSELWSWGICHSLVLAPQFLLHKNCKNRCSASSLLDLEQPSTLLLSGWCPWVLKTLVLMNCLDKYRGLEFNSKFNPSSSRSSPNGC